jgi:hypothetical protein
MTAKNFKIDGHDIKQLIQPIGGCMATDKITVNGELVDFMYRDTPDFKNDSGWRFLSGTESQEYADNANNWAIYDVNTIANYDPSIIDYLESPIGTELERIKGTNKFRTVES